MANSQKMSGGSNEALLTLDFDSNDRDTGRPMCVTTPSLLYEADTEQDILLSYSWLAERGFDVCPRRHGLQGTANHHIVWIPGISSQPTNVRAVNCRQTGSEFVTATDVAPKQALDLFSGYGSAARVLRAHGYQVTTLDNNPGFGADICMDIREWAPPISTLATST